MIVYFIKADMMAGTEGWRTPAVLVYAAPSEDTLIPGSLLLEELARFPTEMAHETDYFRITNVYLKNERYVKQRGIRLQTGSKIVKAM